MYTLDECEPHHIFQVGCNLRQADQDECFAGGFENPVEALMWSVELSDESCTVFLDGEPVGIWGFSDEYDGSCVVWTVGTDRLVENPLALHKASILFRDALFERFDTLRNTVFKENLVHLEWLRRLGAEFTETEDPAFLEFEITKP